jgi:hypothetical protein
VLCAGEATRWGNHLGVPKHLIRIGGESLLRRHVRLVKQIRPDAEVFIVTRKYSKRYDVAGATQVVVPITADNYDADKFLSSRHLWAGRTVLLYGDTYITTKVMEQMLSDRDYPDGWWVYCRLGASSFTGTKWGENFAHVVDEVAHNRYEESLRELVEMFIREEVSRIGGWEQYQHLSGREVLPPVHDEIPDLGNVTSVDDWSDDFDYPEDYDRWCRMFAMANTKRRGLCS